MRPWIAVLMLTLPLTATAAGDPKVGQKLHDQRCNSCHIQRYGNDGTEMYSRSNRIIKSLSALRQRVAMCASQTNAKWFPDEEEHVTAYLNQRFYQFKN